MQTIDPMLESFQRFIELLVKFQQATRISKLKNIQYLMQEERSNILRLASDFLELENNFLSDDDLQQPVIQRLTMLESFQRFIELLVKFRQEARRSKLKNIQYLMQEERSNILRLASDLVKSGFLNEDLKQLVENSLNIRCILEEDASSENDELSPEEHQAIRAVYRRA